MMEITMILIHNECLFWPQHRFFFLIIQWLMVRADNKYYKKAVKNITVQYNNKLLRNDFESLFYYLQYVWWGFHNNSLSIFLFHIQIRLLSNISNTPQCFFLFFTKWFSLLHWYPFCELEVMSHINKLDEP